MDRQEAEWLLANFKAPVVKQDSRGRPGHTVWGRATLLRIKNDDEAFIKPFGHQKEEICELRFLKKWNAWTPGEAPPLAVKPLTVSIGEIMHPNAVKRPVGNPALVPGKTKEDYFAPKYTPGQWAEAKKLKEMGKKTKDIVVITGIPEGSLYPFFAKEGLAKKHKPKPSKLAVAPLTIPPVVAAVPIAAVVDADDKLDAIRAVLSMKLSHKSKCLMIEGLVSHD